MVKNVQVQGGVFKRVVFVLPTVQNQKIFSLQLTLERLK